MTTTIQLMCNVTTPNCQFRPTTCGPTIRNGFFFSDVWRKENCCTETWVVLNVVHTVQNGFYQNTGQNVSHVCGVCCSLYNIALEYQPVLPRIHDLAIQMWESQNCGRDDVDLIFWEIGLHRKLVQRDPQTIFFSISRVFSVYSALHRHHQRHIFLRQGHGEHRCFPKVKTVIKS